MHPEESRLHYMDNLRAIIMTLGVFFHAALAYSPALHGVWFSADQVNSPIMDHLVAFTHQFRMPLFFAIAGFFAALLVERRGLGAMLKNRSLRVLLPFVIFWPLVTLGIILPIGWAIAQVQNLSPLLQFIAYMQNQPDAPKPPPTTAHLWFLYYLMFFYLLTWVARTLLPASLGEKLLQLHPLILICILPLLLLPALALAQLPFPAPDSFLPQLWALLFFGSFFAFGYLLYRSSNVVNYFARRWYWLMLASLLAYIPFSVFSPEQVGFEPISLPWPEKLVLMLSTAAISVWMSLTGLAFARSCLNQRNGFMRFFSDASYWIYIVHLPILLAIQYWLLDQAGGWFYKYTLSVSLTLVICVASYLLLVRWTPIGWMLNGRRRV
jgi:glucan biosynthesis protein C